MAKKKPKPMTAAEKAGRARCYAAGGCGPVPTGPFKPVRVEIPAFPRALTKGDPVGQRGMDLRDYFAAQALMGMLASGHQEAIETVWIASGESAAGGLALAAYELADAMLEARKQ